MAVKLIWSTFAYQQAIDGPPAFERMELTAQYNLTLHGVSSAPKLYTFGIGNCLTVSPGIVGKEKIDAVLPLWMGMEMLGGKSTDEIYETNPGMFQRQDVIDTTIDAIGKVFDHLSAHDQLIYADINGENIKSRSADVYDPVLIDYGIMNKLSSGPGGIGFRRKPGAFEAGTRPYMPSNGFSYPADSYESLGFLLWRMVTGVLPWEIEHSKARLKSTADIIRQETNNAREAELKTNLVDATEDDREYYMDEYNSYVEPSKAEFMVLAKEREITKLKKSSVPPPQLQSFFAKVRAAVELPYGRQFTLHNLGYAVPQEEGKEPTTPGSRSPWSKFLITMDPAIVPVALSTDPKKHKMVIRLLQLIKDSNPKLTYSNIWFQYYDGSSPPTIAAKKMLARYKEGKFFSPRSIFSNVDLSKLDPSIPSNYRDLIDEDTLSRMIYVGNRIRGLR